MKLNELLPHLEKEINEHMDTFTMLGKQAKKINSKIEQLEDEKEAKYTEMKEIVSQLKYVLPIVKEQNPSIIPLLNEWAKPEEATHCDARGVDVEQD